MCNFIMIMILLVTAYTGIAKKGRRHGNAKSYTQGYSKYFRRPRVRTASGGVLLCILAMVLMARHLPAGSSDGAGPMVSEDQRQNNRIV